MPSWSRALLGSAAHAVDRAALAAARLHRVRRPSRADSMSHAERLEALAWIRDAYGTPRFRADVDAFFVPPPAATPRAIRHVRELPHGAAVWDARWESDFEPHLDDIRAKYLSHERNRTAWARLYLGDAPPHGEARRPAVILVHGYLAGQWPVEERAWPLGWLARHGIDAALPVLPFHALRARADRIGPPPFPGADPRFTIEGFRQAMFDLRALIGFFRARGASSVGVMGMSLGGYTTALLATVERDLAFAVPFIPLASLADFAREQGRLGDSAQAAEQHRALEEVYELVSPLSRPSRVPPGRTLVVASERDGITPITHAERLAAHLDATLVRMPGGHLVQVGRTRAFRRIGQMLREIGIVDGPAVHA